MKIDDLTVAIATLDRPDDLSCCLSALLANDVLPAEVIVVDQSESQSARSIVDAIAGASIPVVYIHQAQRGLSASRNAAIESAHSPMIAFTDDDCAPDSNWVKALEQSFAAPPFPDAVCGSVLPLGPDIPGFYSVSPRQSPIRADYKQKHIPWEIGTGGNFAVRKAWFERVGEFDERLGAGSPGRAAEDSDLIYRLLRGGALIRYEPAAVVFHKRQDKSKRLSSRWNYGFGVGAFCGRWMRHDGYIINTVFYWLFGLLRELVGSLAKREWVEAHQRVLSFAGTLRGLYYGFKIGFL